MNRYAVNSIWASKRRKIPKYLMAAASDCYHEKTSLIPFKILQIQNRKIHGSPNIVTSYWFAQIVWYYFKTEINFSSLSLP